MAEPRIFPKSHPEMPGGAGATTPPPAAPDPAVAMGEAAGTARQAAANFSSTAEMAGESLKWVGPGFDMVTRANARMLRATLEVGRECVDIVQESVARNVEGLAALSRARTLPDLLAAHMDLLQDNVHQASEGARRLVSRTMDAVSAEASGGGSPGMPGAGGPPPA
jgi:hypothetical protein